MPAVGLEGDQGAGGEDAVEAGDVPGDDLGGTINADLAIVHAWKGDREGNLVYRKTARNFGPVMATAATLAIAQVGRVVDVGAIDPEAVVTPGIYVDRMVMIDKQSS